MKKYLIILLFIALSFSFIHLSVHASVNASIQLSFDKNIYQTGETVTLEITGNNINDFYGIQIDTLVPLALSMDTTTPYDTTNNYLLSEGATVYDNDYSSGIATLIIVKNEAPGVSVSEEKILAKITFTANENIDNILSVFTVTSDFDDITYGLANMSIKLSDSNANAIEYNTTIEYKEYAFYLIGDAEYYIEAGEEYTDQGVFYPEAATVETTTTLSDSTVVGTYDYAYHLTDGGVDLTLHRTVIVYDSTPPTFTVPSAISREVSNLDIDILSYVTNVYDVADKNPTIQIINPIGDYKLPGVYTILVIVKDASNNSLTKTITVTLFDETAPSFTCLNQTIQAGEFSNVDWTTFITDAADNATGILTYSEVSDSVDYNTAGSYSVVLRVSDASGNYLDQTITVIVEAIPVVQYTVTFYQEDGTTVISEVLVNEGETVVAPTYTVTGYNTKGWLLDGTTYDFSTPVTEDISLTALLVKNTGCFAGLFGDISMVLLSSALVVAFIYTRKK